MHISRTDSGASLSALLISICSLHAQPQQC
jgi:hypothetical protein